MCALSVFKYCPRKEYLYELRFVDILLIVRGYFNRQHAGWEQARFIAYHVRYCMGVKPGDVVPTVKKWYPFPWEQAIINSTLPTPEEEAELQQEMQNFKW